MPWFNTSPPSRRGLWPGYLVWVLVWVLRFRVASAIALSQKDFLHQLQIWWS